MKDKYGKKYFSNWYNKREIDRYQIFKYNYRFLIKKKPNIKSILDIGCALGDFLSLCELNNIKTYGVDTSRHALEITRPRIKAKLYKFDANQEQLPFKNEFFDAVVIFDVIEHLKSCKLVFNEVYRVLKPGGILFCTTPRGNSKFGQFLSNFFQDDPTHINKKSEIEWREELMTAGFSQIEILGTLFYGIPPVAGIRRILRKIFPKFSPPVRPVLINKLLFLTTVLYITAYKK